MTDLVIDTKDLRKSFGATEAVRGLDLRVRRGVICGFLGRNGAGKTTTMKMLMGLTRPTAGIARVLDLDVEAPGCGTAIRERTAFVSEEKDLYDSMTVAGIPSARGTFTGTLNPEAATIEGNYVEGALNAPVIFRRAN